MSNLLCIMLACLAAAFAVPVLAEREVHVVAIAKGYRTAEPYALPEARVLVDRPGQDVGLVLLDRGRVHWRIEATDGTQISEIIRSGPGPEDSAVSLSDIPMAGVQVTGLPLALNPWGRDFRSVVKQVTERMGTDRIHSFQGAYQAHEDAIRVNHADRSTAALARDHLTGMIIPSHDLAPEIRDWMQTGDARRRFSLIFDRTGVRLTGPDGIRHLPVTADVPKILLPVAAVFDPASRTVYCSTYGAEGYLYAIDVDTGAWSVVTSLEEYDSAGLLFDAEDRLLITTGAFSRPGEIRVFGLDGSRLSRFYPTTDFPGLTDIFDYGNEHGPPLTPKVYSDGWLLLEALASPEARYPDHGPYRIYAVHLETGELRLLRFRDD